MKALHFVYNGFNEYEVGLACALLAAKGELFTASLGGEIVKGEGNFTLQPDYSLNLIQPDNYDLLLISGMLNLENYWDEDSIFQMISEFDSKNKILAAICGGPLFLAKAGALKGKRYTCGIPLESREEVGVFSAAEYVEENIVVDQNVITAKGFATVDFSLAIGDQLNLFTGKDRIEFANYWKESKS